MIFQPNPTWSVSLGHRYLANDPALGPDGGHNLIYDRVYYRFNENWAVRMSHYFEARDGVMEEQSYTLYRDLRNWTSALTFRHRQNRVGRPDDYTIGLSFSLKFAPRSVTPTNGNGNGTPRTGNQRQATQSQVKAIHAIARNRRIDITQFLNDRFHVSKPDDLSIKDASKVIDELKAEEGRQG